MNIFKIFENEVVRSSSYVFLASAIVQLTQLLMNLYFANQFIVLYGIDGQAVFGNFKTLLYLTTFLPLLIDLGANATIIKYTAEFSVKANRKIPGLIRSFLKIRVASYFILLLTIFLLKDQIAFYFLKDASLSYWVIPSALIIGLSFFNIFNYIILGFQNFKLYFLNQVLFTILTAVGSISLTSFGVFYIFLGWNLGVFGYLVYFKFLKGKNIFEKSSKIDFKKIYIRYSLPMYALSIPVAFPSIIVPIMSLLFPSQLIGLFAFAFMFYFAATLVPTALATVLLPKTSEFDGLKKYDRAKHILSKVLVWYSLFVFAGIIAVLLFSETFLSLPYFANYLSSLPFFRSLLIFGLLAGYLQIYTAYLSGLARIKRVAAVVLIQNALLFLISYLLLKGF